MTAATKAGTSPLARERQRGRDAERDAVLHEAHRIVVEDGPAALTVRRLAERLGCSTIIVYRRFGGKQGVVDALYLDAFSRLEADLSAVRHTDDPRADLLRLTAAYRRAAHERPDDYRLMFDRVYLGFEPSEDARQQTHRSFAILRDAIARLDHLGTHPPQQVAELIWAAAHGLVLLELGGHLPATRQARRLRVLVESLLDGLQSDDTGASTRPSPRRRPDPT